MQLADIAKAMKCYQSSKGNICEGIIATKDRKTKEIYIYQHILRVFLSTIHR